MQVGRKDAGKPDLNQVFPSEEMKKLEIYSRYAGRRNEVNILDFKGSLNITTFNQFEGFLKPFSGEGAVKIVLNFSQLTSISSFGLGLLAGMMHNPDGLEDVNLAEVPKKIKQLLEKVQPAEYRYKIFEHESEAVQFFLNQQTSAYAHHFVLTSPPAEVISGKPFILEIAAYDASDHLIEAYQGKPHLIVDRGMVSPTLITDFKHGLWEGKVIVTGNGPLQFFAWDECGWGETTIRPKAQGEPAKFPIVVVCSGCGKNNIAGKTDFFRCIQCNEIYFVDWFGHVVPLKPGNTKRADFVKHLEFKIPSDVNYLNHVRNFIMGICSEEKIDEEKITQIEMSLDEALANVIEHAYSFDAYQEIRVNLWIYAHKLEIVIKDYGRSFDSERLPLPDIKKHIEERRIGGLGRYLIKTLMDEVTYHKALHCNELRMIKRF